MPPKSKVYALPPHILSYLDETLAGNGGQQYVALEKELEKRGYKVAKSGLQRYYANDLEPRLKALNMATKMAETVAAASGTGATMLKGTVCLLQEKIFRVLVDCDSGGEELDADNLSKLTRAVSDLSRASMQVEKFVAEARTKALADAASAVEKAAVQQGLNADQAAFWRQQVLGVQ
jgi:hypothetical protein